MSYKSGSDWFDHTHMQDINRKRQQQLQQYEKKEKKMIEHNSESLYTRFSSLPYRNVKGGMFRSHFSNRLQQPLSLNRASEYIVPKAPFSRVWS